MGAIPHRAAEAVAAILAEPGCLGVVGPKNSGSALAAAPLAAAAGLPLVLPCATADELTGEGGVVFRLCAPDQLTAAAAVELAIELGVGRLAVLADDTAYGQGLARTRARRGRRGRAGGRRRSVDRSRRRLPRHGRGRAGRADGRAARRRLRRRLASRRREVRTPRSPPWPGRRRKAPGCSTPGRPVDGRSVYAAEAADAARILLAAGAGGPAAIRAGSFDGETGAIRFTVHRRARRCRRQPLPRRRRRRPARQLIRTRASSSA